MSATGSRCTREIDFSQSLRPATRPPWELDFRFCVFHFVWYSGTRATNQYARQLQSIKTDVEKLLPDVPDMGRMNKTIRCLEMCLKDIR